MTIYATTSKVSTSRSPIDLRRKVSSQKTRELCLFFLQDEDPDYGSVAITPDQVPTELADFGDMITPDALEADDMTDDIVDEY